MKSKLLWMILAGATSIASTVWADADNEDKNVSAQDSHSAEKVESTEPTLPDKFAYWWNAPKLIEEITFSEVYPKSFYETDGFTYAVIGGSMVAAATVTYVTAGAGAPAVIPGVSTLIVAAGGGGQGAYMAGLSTVGNVIGSNAIGGAALINGLGASFGLTATTSKAAAFGIALKSMTGVAASGYDGILVGEHKETQKLTFVTEIRLPEDIGSKRVKALVESIYEHEKKIAEAYAKNDEIEGKRYASYRQADLDAGVALLKSDQPSWSNEEKQPVLTRDDLITLAVVAHRSGDFKLFNETVQYIKDKCEDTDYPKSYLSYLYSTSLLMQSKFEEGASALKNSIDVEPGVIETNLLYIVYLANIGFEANEDVIRSRVKMLEKQFDDDDYESGYTLSSVYFRLGTLYAQEKRYPKALEYFEKAGSNLNWLQKWGVFSGFIDQKFRDDIDLEMSNSYYCSGSKTKAKEVYDNLLSRTEDPQRQDAYNKSYAGADGRCP